MKSPLKLISESNQLYQADIDYVLTDDNPWQEKVEVFLDPSTIAYHLEPGEVAEVRRNLNGKLRSNNDQHSVEVTFNEEMYNIDADVAIYHTKRDTRLDALGGESATLNLERSPIKRKDSGTYNKAT